GFGEMDIALREQEGSDAWEETNLNELLRRGSVDAPGNGPPPPVPDDRTLELADMEGRLRHDAMRRAAEMNLAAKSDAEHAHVARPDVRPSSPGAVDSVSQAMAQVQQRSDALDVDDDEVAVP